MTVPVTLRSACIKKTLGLLMSGAWDGCEENPFQCMPASVVQELMSHMHPEGAERSIAHYRLLLTSGRLEHVALPPGVNEERSVALLQMLSRGCRNLRTLSIMGHYCSIRGVAEQRALREVLRRSIKLQHLHSGILFDKDDLDNCSNLKTLRLHFGTEKEYEVFLHLITSDLWKGSSVSHPLRSVEVLAMCCNLSMLFPVRSSFVISEIAMLLDNCPQLTSLGFLESSAALKEIHDRGLRTRGAPHPFQLRRCYWRAGINVGQSEYCDTIRVAAQSCPLLEVLVIKVSHADVLRHLKTLSNLSCLIIYLTDYEDDPWREFYSLLHHIGPQLRHLCVYKRDGGRSINVNSIAGNCPNLDTLQIFCSVSVDEGLSFPDLERLSTSMHTRSLLPLLSSCPRLKVLCLERAYCLEDGELQPILLKNSFAELEVALIRSCCLSESGWRRFIQSASGLRSCCLRSLILRDYVVMQCVKDLNPSVLCHSPDDFDKLRCEHFPGTLFSKCWL